MSDRDTKLIRQARSTRLSFPDDESRQAWLPLLLEACAIVDAGVNEAIRREEAQGRALACHKGGQLLHGHVQGRLHQLGAVSAQAERCQPLENRRGGPLAGLQPDVERGTEEAGLLD